MHLAILTRQIGHYHDARYRAAASVLSRVTVVSTANEGGFKEFLAQDLGGYAVERLFPDRTAYDAAVRNRRLGQTLEAVLDAIAPDTLAVCGWTNPESVVAIAWGRRRDVPIVMMSETQADDAVRSFFREAIKRHIVSLCDAALVGGPPHASYIAALGIFPDRIHLGYNAVDNDHFSLGAAVARADAESHRAAHGLPDRYVLASARFIAKKNLPALVAGYARAVSASDAQTPDLVILGDGEMRGAITAAAAEGGVSARIHLPGFRGYEILPTYYGLAEAFIHVSTVEQWGLVVNEAMAAGIPVIVSKRCGVGRSVITEGHSGFLIAPDVASIEAAFLRLFAMDQTERSAIGAAAAAAIADWGPARFAAGIKAAVESAQMAPRRGPPRLSDRTILAWMERAVITRVT